MSSYLKTGCKKDCYGCGACVKVCPQSCMTMEADEEGFSYPRIDKDQCIRCGKCERACPAEMGNVPFASELDLAFALWLKDDEQRLKSSSGGAFTALSDEVFAREGIVFAAGYDDKLRVVHKCAHNQDERNRMRGSKYVESALEDQYLRVKEALEQDRFVLFVGAPCQVAGLYAFLGGTYDQLITADFICSGNSSPDIFAKYIAYRQAKIKSPIIDVLFREKRRGWEKRNMVLTLQDGKEKVYPSEIDPFYSIFTRRIAARPSCYHCRFAKPQREADFTIADFWGVKQNYPTLYDAKGVSLVLVNSEKAHNLIHFFEDKAEIVGVEKSKALLRQSTMRRPMPEPKHRKRFFQLVQDKGLLWAVWRCIYLERVKERTIGKLLPKKAKK